MFTVEQIKAAHSKVKSGADFPGYISDLKNLGVIAYETLVTDGHTNYHGADAYNVSSPGWYSALDIADTPNVELFKANLKAHQQGQTDYMTFCNHCANAGVDKWIVSILDMTCCYYDKAGNKLLIEAIPQQT